MPTINTIGYICSHLEVGELHEEDSTRLAFISLLYMDKLLIDRT